MGVMWWLWVAQGWSATLDVGPAAPYATVQAAVDAAVSGDVVRVAPGVYDEDLDVIAKELSLVGSGPGVVGRGVLPQQEVLYIDDAPVSVEGITFDANGGRGVRAIDQVTLVDVVVEGAEAGTGGCALQATYGGVLQRVVVRDSDCPSLVVNLGTTWGDLRVVDSTFEGNHGSTSGAVYIGGALGSAQIVFEGNLFRDNVSADDGGALEIYPGSRDVSVRRNTFCGNVAADRGGALYVASVGEARLRAAGNVFVGNSAAEGGAVAVSNTAYYVNEVLRLALVRSVFLGNAAPSGAAVHGVDGALDVGGLNLVFQGNTGSAAWELTGSDGHLDYSVLHDHPDGMWRFGASVGPAVFEADPLLVDATVDCDVFDVALGPGSPGIDAGAPWLPLDVDGSVSDLGASP